MQNELGDQIQVLFVESQNSTDEAIAEKQLQLKWLSGRAMWTKERPFDTGSRGLPSFALLDADGNVVLKGSSNAMHKQIVESIDEMLKASNEAPDDMPKAVAKAIVDIRKGDYDKANAVLAKLVEKPSGPDPASMKTAAEGAQVQLMARVEGELKRVQWMLENGYPLAAEDHFKSLSKRSKGLVGIQEGMKDLAAKLTSADFKPELEVAKALNKLEQKFFSDYKGSYKKKFEKLVEKYADTKVATRAAYWTEFAK